MYVHLLHGTCLVHIRMNRAGCEHSLHRRQQYPVDSIQASSFFTCAAHKALDEEDDMRVLVLDTYK